MGPCSYPDGGRNRRAVCSCAARDECFQMFDLQRRTVCRLITARRGVAALSVFMMVCL